MGILKKKRCAAFYPDHTAFIDQQFSLLELFEECVDFNSNHALRRGAER